MSIARGVTFQASATATVTNASQRSPVQSIGWQAAGQNDGRHQPEAEFQAQAQASDGQRVDHGFAELIVRGDATQGPQAPVPLSITEAKQQRGNDRRQREGAQIEYEGHQAPDMALS